MNGTASEELRLFGKANKKAREGKFKEALEIYKSISCKSNSLSKSIDFNIRYASRKLEGYESPVGKALPRKNVNISSEHAALNRQVDAAVRIKCGINSIKESDTHINGWLLSESSVSSRLVSIYIDDAFIYEVCADRYREDLVRLGYKGGKYGFSVSIPERYLDGKAHSVSVYDKEAGKAYAKKSFKVSPKDNFKDFEEMLKYTYLDPVISAPFNENKKRCFAYMDVLAKEYSSFSLKQERKPKVSVLMSVFNRENIVSSAISSILSQDYANIEIIIGDDGSADDTVNVIKSFRDSRITLIEGEKNKGKSSVLNSLFESSSGEWIAYLDSDNTWESNYISSMLGAALIDGNSEVFYSGQFLFRGDEEKPFGARYCSFNRNLLFNRNYIDHNSFFHKKEVFEKLGGYDVKLRRCLDYDFIVRAAVDFNVTSVPVILTNYYYEAAKNSITSNVDLIKDLKYVRKESQGYLAESHWVSKSGYLDDILSMPVNKMSVVIPSYESLRDLSECIDALLGLEEREFVEVIVVDNDSSEDIKDYLRVMHDKGEIRAIINDFNYGFTYAVNQGIDAADPSSDIILLNNDAVPTNRSLELLSRFANFKDDAGLIVPAQIFEPNTKTMAVHVPFANVKHYCDVNVSVHHDNIDKIPLLVDGRYLKLKFAPFFCVYIPRSTIKEIGILDAELGRHYRSDRLYSNKVRSFLGKEIYYVPDARVIHKLQRSTEKLKTKKSTGFDLMFKKNQWPEEVLCELGFKKRSWDC